MPARLPTLSPHPDLSTWFLICAPAFLVFALPVLVHELGILMLATGALLGLAGAILYPTWPRLVAGGAFFVAGVGLIPAIRIIQHLTN